MTLRLVNNQPIISPKPKTISQPETCLRLQINTNVFFIGFRLVEDMMANSGMFSCFFLVLPCNMRGHYHRVLSLVRITKVFH